jgi:hypothetical protein
MGYFYKGSEPNAEGRGREGEGRMMMRVNKNKSLVY